MNWSTDCSFILPRNYCTSKFHILWALILGSNQKANILYWAGAKNIKKHWIVSSFAETFFCVFYKNIMNWSVECGFFLPRIDFLVVPKSTKYSVFFQNSVVSHNNRTINKYTVSKHQVRLFSLWKRLQITNGESHLNQRINLQ